MKKILLVMLVVISLFSLMACGSQEESNEPYFPETDLSTETDELPTQKTVEDTIIRTAFPIPRMKIIISLCT